MTTINRRFGNLRNVAPVSGQVSSVARMNAARASNASSVGVQNRSPLNQQMSRGQFLRTAGMVGGAVAAAGLGLGGVARAAGPSYIEVLPSEGLAGVKNAISNIAPGGSILLKAGTFYFGNDTVYIDKTVLIQGEGSWATKIQGGIMSFTVINGNPTIQNIWFDSNYFCPMQLFTCTGLTFSGNKITNVISYDAGEGISNAYGVYGTELNDDYTVTTKSITGNINISENEIHLSSDQTTFEAVDIALFVLLGSVNISITNNKCYNNFDPNTWLLEGISLLSYPNGIANISGNYMYNEPNFQFETAGIAVASQRNDLSPTGSYGAPGPTIVYDNHVFGIYGYGMYLGGECSGCQVTKNEFQINPDYASYFGGVGILLLANPFSAAHDNIISENTISGSGLAGIWVLPGVNNNDISQNIYTSSNFLGWSVVNNNIQSGCVLLDIGSFGNRVNETIFPTGSVCTQVADLTVYNANPRIVGSNTIACISPNTGCASQCNLQVYHKLMTSIKQSQKYQALKAEIAAKHPAQAQGPKKMLMF